MNSSRLFSALVITVLVLAVAALIWWATRPAVSTPPTSEASRAPGRPTASGEPDQAGISLQGMELAGVKTVVVTTQPMHRMVQMSGQVVLVETGKADITVPLTGVIERPLVKVGDLVDEGTPVAVINSVYGQTSLQILQKIETDQAALVSAQSALTQAQNGLAQARSAYAAARTASAQAIDGYNQARAEDVNASKDYIRKQRLFAHGVFAQSDVDDAHERFVKARSAVVDTRDVVKQTKYAVDVAQANIPPAAQNVRLGGQSVGIARATVERDKVIFGQESLIGSTLPKNLTPVNTSGRGFDPASAARSTEFYLRAPIAGTVSNVVMAAGMAVGPQTVVASIVNNAQVYVDANAFESDLPFVKVGDAVTVTVAAYPSLQFKGHVHYVGKVVDPTSRTVAVRTLITNQSDILKPAMFAQVALAAAGRLPTLVVPDNAVLIHGDQRFVYVNKGNQQFDKRKVVVGLSSQGQTEIMSGLRSGERVVTDGNLLLQGQE